MTCANCKHFSVRGNYVGGKFIQNTKDGGKAGWCQKNPPHAGFDAWPQVSEVESCSDFEEKMVPACYKRFWESSSKRAAVLKRKLLAQKNLVAQIGSLAVLVGLPKSTSRKKILEAVKAKLDANS